MVDPGDGFTTLDESGESASQYSSPAAERVAMAQWSSSESGEATNGGFISDANAPMDQPDNYRDLWQTAANDD